MHWVFCFKYWVVACKLQQIKLGIKNENDNFNFKLIGFFGLVFCAISGVYFGVRGVLILFYPTSIAINVLFLMIVPTS